jgi:hypothetical protein
MYFCLDTKVPKNQGCEFPRPFASAPQNESKVTPYWFPVHRRMRALRDLGFVKHCSASSNREFKAGKVQRKKCGSQGKLV